MIWRAWATRCQNAGYGGYATKRESARCSASAGATTPRLVCRSMMTWYSGISPPNSPNSCGDQYHRALRRGGHTVFVCDLGRVQQPNRGLLDGLSDEGPTGGPRPEYGGSAPGTPTGIQVHSVRGSQFRSRKFTQALEFHGLVGSMARFGAAGDNAALESVFSLSMKVRWNITGTSSFSCEHQQ